MTITIMNPDGGNFILNIQNPKTNQMWASDQISTKSGTWPLTVAIQNFYYSTWGIGVAVNLIMYDVNNIVTTSSKLGVKYVYTVNVGKSIPSASTNNILVQKVSTKSTITIGLPVNVQLSSPPLKGSFKITCSISPT